MTTAMTRPTTTPAAPAPRPWHRHLGALLIAVLGSAVWAGLVYLATHLSLHWR